jgi:hypothetical protein
VLVVETRTAPTNSTELVLKIAIPKTKVDRYGDQQFYFDIPESSLKDFEM